MFTEFVENSVSIFHEIKNIVVEPAAAKIATEQSYIGEFVDGTKNDMHNCNFFDVDADGRFSRVIIWMAGTNPLKGRGVPLPLGGGTLYRRGMGVHPSGSQSSRSCVRLRPGLLVSLHCSRPRGEVVVSRSSLRVASQEPCSRGLEAGPVDGVTARVEASYGRGAASRSN